VPVWEGARNRDLGRGTHGWIGWLAPESLGDVNYYTNMYATRYDSAIDVTRRIAEDHESLLERVLAWQSVIYGERHLPVWLRESLVNNLYLIVEDSHWAQARPPLGDFVFPDGGFALNESPRGCPQIACIPCDWYGNF